MSKGSYGVSMGAIEHRKPPRGNRHCKDCVHLVRGRTVIKPATETKQPLYAKEPYRCELKGKPRYYTAVCHCKDFEGKTSD